MTPDQVLQLLERQIATGDGSHANGQALHAARDYIRAQHQQAQEILKLVDVHNAHAARFRDPDHPEAQRHHGVVSGLWLAMDKLTDPTPPP